MHPSIATADRLDAIGDNTAISTYTGRPFDIFDEGTWDFSKRDIAHALSTICRFGGHVDFYSVGEHSIHVASMLRDWGAPPDTQLLGLLHDASEAYVLDIPRPWKSSVYIGTRTYEEVEHDIQTQLFEWAGVSYAFEHDWDYVREADMEMYNIEAKMRPSPAQLNMHPQTLRTEFLWLWDDLEGAV